MLRRRRPRLARGLLLVLLAPRARTRGGSAADAAVAAWPVVFGAAARFLARRCCLARSSSAGARRAARSAPPPLPPLWRCCSLHPRLADLSVAARGPGSSVALVSPAADTFLSAGFTAAAGDTASPARSAMCFIPPRSTRVGWPRRRRRLTCPIAVAPSLRRRRFDPLLAGDSRRTPARRVHDGRLRRRGRLAGRLAAAPPLRRCHRFRPPASAGRSSARSHSADGCW